MKLQPMPTPTITGPSNGGSITLRPIFGTGPTGATGAAGTNGTNGIDGLPGVNAVANDTATATYINTPGSNTAVALSASIGVQVETPGTPAFIAQRNLEQKQGGAYLGPYYDDAWSVDGAGAVNAQVAMTNATDAINQQQGGQVVLPAAVLTKVDQVVIPRGMTLRGPSTFAGFGRDRLVARLQQNSGVNTPTVIFSRNAGDVSTRPFVGPFAIHDILFSKVAGDTGHHISIETSLDHAEGKLQDFTTIERLGFRGGDSGVYFNGGSPVRMYRLAGIGLRGYVVEGIDKHRDVVNGDIHQVLLQDISGDACMGYVFHTGGDSRVDGGAAVYLEGMQPWTVQTLRDIKSEYRIWLPSDGGAPATDVDSTKPMGCFNSIILKDCESMITIDGNGHIATGSQLRRPGANVLLKGSVRPDLDIRGDNIRVESTQTVGATPGTLRDEVSGTPVEIVMHGGRYNTSGVRYDLSVSSAGTGWRKGVPGAVVPSVASPGESLSGSTPSRSWWETDGDTDEKLTSIVASGGNLSIRTHHDDGTAGNLILELVRNGVGVDFAKWLTSVVPATADGFDLGSSSAFWRELFVNRLRLKTGTLPTADATVRGELRWVEGATTVADGLYVCRKDSYDNYTWMALDQTANAKIDLKARANRKSGWYIAPGGSASTAIPAESELHFVPLIIPDTGLSLDRLLAEVTVVGSAGAVVRLGLYLPDVDGLPGARLLDAGTIDGTVVARAPLTISQAVPRGLIYTAAVVQGAAGTRPTMRTTTNSPHQFAVATDSGVTFGFGGYTQTGVTGALPSNATINTASGSAIRVTGRWA